MMSKIIALIFSFLILMVLEGAAYLYISNTPLGQIQKLIQEDQLLLWKQRPNLDLNFMGVKVHTDSDGFRIFNSKIKSEKHNINITIFGPSSCFGWGVEDEETYAAILEKNLNHCDSVKKYKVKNASQIGYSSYQGKKLFDLQINESRPNIVIISYLINDLDHYRFFQSYPVTDSQLNTIEKNSSFKFIKELNLFKVLDLFVNKLKQRQRSHFVTRVPISDYQANIQSMIDRAKQSNSRVILLKMPVSLPENEETKFINEMAKEYNKKLLEIASINKVEALDVVTIFQKEKDYLFIDPKKDTYHPNQKGHKIIANELTKVILKELNYSVDCLVK